MRAFLIDTDPGVDDAFAILMCLQEPKVQLRALTVLGGNVGLPHTMRNACTLADLAHTALKVYAGAARPLVGQAPDAAFVHGNDGFGDANLPAPSSTIETNHAALAIIEHANACAGTLEILALGPLTNIALALALDPTLPSKVKRLIIMGGAVRAQGNITAFAEFNIAVDPEAAQSVLTRWPNAELVDWEATLKFAPSIAETERWFASSSTTAQFMHTISRKTLTFKQSIAGALGADARWAWADPLAAYVALYPERCTFQCAGVEVIREGAARGTTLVNTRESSLKILTEIQLQDFHAVMAATLGVD
jgi:purine nucleosidase